MDPVISSLIDRAGLDRGNVRQIMGRGLEGADDGELFLEYRQAEALTCPGPYRSLPAQAGKLRYGPGLRLASGEGRSRRLCPRLGRV